MLFQIYYLNEFVILVDIIFFIVNSFKMSLPNLHNYLVLKDIFKKIIRYK